MRIILLLVVCVQTWRRAGAEHRISLFHGRECREGGDLVEAFLEGDVVALERGEMNAVVNVRQGGMILGGETRLLSELDILDFRLTVKVLARGTLFKLAVQLFASPSCFCTKTTLHQVDSAPRRLCTKTTLH